MPLFTCKETEKGDQEDVPVELRIGMENQKLPISFKALELPKPAANSWNAICENKIV